MSTPAKRSRRGPAAELDSSFQKRFRKISIEGNIGERGGGDVCGERLFPIPAGEGTAARGNGLMAKSRTALEEPCCEAPAGEPRCIRAPLRSGTTTRGGGAAFHHPQPPAVQDGCIPSLLCTSAVPPGAITTRLLSARPHPPGSSCEPPPVTALGSSRPQAALHTSAQPPPAGHLIAHARGFLSSPPPAQHRAGAAAPLCPASPPTTRHCLLLKWRRGRPHEGPVTSLSPGPSPGAAD